MSDGLSYYKLCFLPYSPLQGPDMVICDEGHILKNEASAVSKAMNSIRTRRRVVLTGTPLQNNLIECETDWLQSLPKNIVIARWFCTQDSMHQSRLFFVPLPDHCMVNFIKENLLGSVKEFRNRFINPIQNGQCADSTLHDVRIMKKRAHILYEMLAGCVQVDKTSWNKCLRFLLTTSSLLLKVTDLFFSPHRERITQHSPSSCLRNMNMFCQSEWPQSSLNCTDTIWSTSQVRIALNAVFCLTGAKGVKRQSHLIVWPKLIFYGVKSSTASRGC